MSKQDYDAAAILAQCDDGAWPCVWFELKRGALLTPLRSSPRYALWDGVELYGPTLSAGRVADLTRQGVLEPAGRFRYRLANKIGGANKAA